MYWKLIWFRPAPYLQVVQWGVEGGGQVQVGRGKDLPQRLLHVRQCAAQDQARFTVAQVVLIGTQ